MGYRAQDLRAHSAGGEVRYLPYLMNDLCNFVSLFPSNRGYIKSLVGL